MPLRKPEFPLSTLQYLNDHLEALKGNKDVDHDILAFNGYNHLFEIVGCTICKTPHGYRFREETRSLSICSSECLANLVKNGLNPYVNVDLQSSPLENEFVQVSGAVLKASAQPEPGEIDGAFQVLNERLRGKNAEDTMITKFVQMTAVPEPKFEDKTARLAMLRMVRSSFAADTEVESTVAAPSNFTLATVEQQLERKWFLRDLKLAPVFHEPGERFEIVYSWSPVCHLLQPAGSGKEALEIRASWNMLQDYYVKVASQPLTALPEQDGVICAVFSGDGSLYRAVVLDVDQELQSVFVRFLDFGGDEHVLLSNCFPVCQKVMEEYPIYGLEFQIECPTTQDSLLEHVDMKMLKLRKNAVLLDTKEKLNPIVWKGDLLFEDGSNLLQKMAIRRAQATGDDKPEVGVQWKALMERPETGKIRQAFKKAIAKAALLQTPKVTLLTSDKDPVEEAFQIVPKGTDVKSATVQKVVPVPDPTLSAGEPWLIPQMRKKKSFSFPSMNYTRSLVDDAKVSISFAWTAGKLTIVAAADNEHMMDFEDAVHSYAKTAPALTAAPEVGSVVLGPYEEGGFYRARVVSKDNRRVNVEFIDLGDRVTLPFNECRQISEELFKVPVYGIILIVDGVAASLPSTEISDALLEKTWTLEIIQRDDVYHWVGQLWDEKDVPFADYVQQNNELTLV